MSASPNLAAPQWTDHMLYAVAPLAPPAVLARLPELPQVARPVSRLVRLLLSLLAQAVLFQCSSLSGAHGALVREDPIEAPALSSLAVGSI